MYCEHCGAAINAESHFCSACGGKSQASGISQPTEQKDFASDRRRGSSQRLRTIILILIPVLLLIVAGFWFASGSLPRPEEAIIGRWEEDGKPNFLEFFNDNTFLWAEGDTQFSGRWAKVGDRRIKVELSMLGITKALVFDDIEISGDKMSFVLDGSAGNLRRKAGVRDDRLLQEKEKKVRAVRATIDAEMKSDLRNAATAQEAFFANGANRYTTRVEDLRGYNPSPGVLLTVEYADATRYVLVARKPGGTVPAFTFDSRTMTITKHEWQEKRPNRFPGRSGNAEAPAKTTLPGSFEYLSRVAEEINRSVPVMIDEEIELMSAVGAPGMLIYNYRLIGYSVTKLDHQKFAAGAKQKVTQRACGSPETRDEFLKKGVTLRYSYVDKDKQHIATLDVKRSDCGV